MPTPNNSQPPDSGPRTPKSVGGRPPLPEGKRRDQVVAIRLTEGEKQRLTAEAKARGISVAAYVRSRALNQAPPSVVPAVNRETLRQLGGVAANLNQSMHQINAGAFSPSHGANVAEALSLLRQLKRDLQVPAETPL